MIRGGSKWHKYFRHDVDSIEATAGHHNYIIFLVILRKKFQDLYFGFSFLSEMLISLSFVKQDCWQLSGLVPPMQSGLTWNNLLSGSRCVDVRCQPSDEIPHGLCHSCRPSLEWGITILQQNRNGPNDHKNGLDSESWRSIVKTQLFFFSKQFSRQSFWWTTFWSFDLCVPPPMCQA